MTFPGETPTLDQTIALSQLGKAHDRFTKVIQRALALGIRPEVIIDFLDDPATRVTNSVLRKIVTDEVVVHGETETEEADTLEPGKIKALNGIVDLGNGSMEDADTIKIPVTKDADGG